MTEGGRHLVFVYGTLKRGEPNCEQMEMEGNGRASFVGCGKTVTKYPLVVGTDYNVPFLLKLENQGHNIVGEVYEVDDQMLATLDEFEGVPLLYQRHPVAIQMTEDKDGQAVGEVVKHCGTYFISEVHQELVKNEWLSEYHTVSERHGQYVKRSGRDKCHPVLKIVFPSKYHA